MKKLITVLSLTAITIATIVVSCQQQGGAPQQQSGEQSGPLPIAAKEGAQGRFPDFGYMLPGYTVSDSVFRLSQDYPTAMPKEIPAFMKIDYKKDWHQYLLAAQAYCFEGNMGAVDFRVERNKVRKWYHMPWQHYGIHGREGFHGLTQEAPVGAYQLGPTQSIDTACAVAVGFYNDIASYTIGQVWKDHNRPDTGNVRFRHGAVLFKILFVTLPVSGVEKQVPSLVNPLVWTAYAVTNSHYVNGDDAAFYRHRAQVLLIQMDVMVRDTTSPNGWVFGNYQYNGTLNRENKWENLAPLGVSWGEDPEDTSSEYYNPTPTVTRINPKLKETIINPDTKELPPTHLGWNGRLDGPVDNPKSSCYSCHSTAEYPQEALMSPSFNSAFYKANPMGSPGWMRWFKNQKCGVPFDSNCHSSDFSYQLSGSLQLYDQWLEQQVVQQSGLYDTAFHPAPGAPVAVAPAPGAPATGPRKLMRAAPARQEEHHSNLSVPHKSAYGRPVVPITFETK